MKSDLVNLIERVPKTVPWKEIVEFERVDERLSAISVLFVNTIEVCEDYIQFCPDNNPPEIEEVLSWIWTFRPDLGGEMLNNELSEDFKMLLSCYNSSEMTKFWEYVNE